MMRKMNAPCKLRPLASLITIISTATVLGGCASLGDSYHRDDKSATNLTAQMPQTHLFASIPKGKLNTASRQLAAEGIKALDAKDYRKASDIFNLAVKVDMTNSYLHFLNGVAYQFRGVTGESALFPLAEQGYQLAVQFDSSNWLARYYGGLLSMHQRNYGDAQKKFAEAALYAGNQPDLLYDLAVASYYNHDPVTAAGALAGLRKLQGSIIDPRILRASAIVAAALNQKDDAKSFLDQMRSTNAPQADISAVEQRIDSWESSYKRGGLIKAALKLDSNGDIIDESGNLVDIREFSTDNNGLSPPPQAEADNNPQENSNLQPDASNLAASSSFVDKQMVVVDVVILGTEEDNSHSMGVNLLDGLKLQFGNPAFGVPAFSKSFNRVQDRLEPSPSVSYGSLAQNTSTITRSIGIAAVSYNLNIANANSIHNEVLARPTLVALSNMTSNFFSGVDINAAAVSTGQGQAIQIRQEVGVKLALTPEFLPDNLIKLNVVAERTFLALPSNSVKFDYRLDTTKTTVNANVVMKFGETLILSGLSERDQSGDRDGVPGLQDVPIIQYLFSRKTSREYTKSVLIMLTPRKAQYTNRSEADIAADRENATPSDLALAEFEYKYKPWFKPIPNIGVITKQLDKSTLYREFRTGDLGSSWQSENNHQERLKTALSFLFY